MVSSAINMLFVRIYIKKKREKNWFYLRFSGISIEEKRRRYQMGKKERKSFVRSTSQPEIYSSFVRFPLWKGKRKKEAAFLSLPMLLSMITIEARMNLNGVKKQSVFGRQTNKKRKKDTVINQDSGSILAESIFFVRSYMYCLSLSSLYTHTHTLAHIWEIVVDLLTFFANDPEAIWDLSIFWPATTSFLFLPLSIDPLEATKETNQTRSTSHKNELTRLY